MTTACCRAALYTSESISTHTSDWSTIDRGLSLILGALKEKQLMRKKLRRRSRQKQLESPQPMRRASSPIRSSTVSELVPDEVNHHNNASAHVSLRFVVIFDLSFY